MALQGPAFSPVLPFKGGGPAARRRQSGPNQNPKKGGSRASGVSGSVAEDKRRKAADAGDAEGATEADGSAEGGSDIYAGNHLI